MMSLTLLVSGSRVLQQQQPEQHAVVTFECQSAICVIMKTVAVTFFLIRKNEREGQKYESCQLHFVY